MKRSNTQNTHAAPSALSRRRFLQTAATATAAVAFGAPFISRAWAAAGAKSPYKNLVSANRKVRVACIGIGGRGYSNLSGIIDAGGEIAALCDVHFERGSRAFYGHPNVPRYRDFRQMLEEMDGKIDAVSVSTPDHMHFPATLMAIERGKHVYVEKPLTHTIGEARILKAAAQKHGIVSQMGNQGHAKEGTRLTKEWIDAGVIGTVREIHSWTNRPGVPGRRPIWPQDVPWPTKDTEKTRYALSPDTLDWNLWLGVAPVRPYTHNLAPFDWRGFWDYGCGALGDMGCHIMDAAYWALDLSGDCKVTADAEGGSVVCGPKASTITYEFPARGSRAPVKYVWYDGGRKPAAPKELGDDGKLSTGGTLYYGDKGIMYSPSDYSESVKLLPESKMKEFTKRPARTIRRIPKANQYREWLDAIQGGAHAPGSNIVDHAAGLTEFVSLGNLALRTGKPIQWDATRAVCTGMPEAQILINKNYRVY
ncbi:putative dehydrogenase [Ereboglobus sp. PH5-5]|uniref:Gfo/Idh/MocA family protein n=1 Tax=Ereboglobus sp. PH5-5 TaxID=2940529 RepID=UPI002406068F|nr:Gfo/Idh/MocA family oxidoreductase [Ereboglobus sp. PH5-5]MDF9832089.1 putative dehydrogenase [Ereboglobus sp. PH5-5]